MTTKEYTKKYEFAPRAFGQAPRPFPQEIYRDLMSELLIQLDFNKANDNLAGFNNSVRVLRMKFDAISNKAYGLLDEKHWNYMFATMIVPLREQYCSREVAALREKREARIREREEREAWEEAQTRAFFGSFTFNPWDFVWAMFADRSKKPQPKEAYEIMGLDLDANLEELDEKYALLIRRHHPDNKETGDHDKCVAINQARADIKAYLTQ